MKTSSELKVCPFCGSGNVKVKRTVGLTGVRCIDCGVIGPMSMKFTKQEAVAAWNRRAEIKEDDR